MGKKDKRVTCLNCDEEFDSSFKFCPHCGQENKSNDLHFKYFIQEFLSANFNVDSKIFQTLKLLIVYPGKLTNEFLAGRKKAYLPPVRLYLIISLVYFTLLSLLNSEILKITDTEPDKKENQVVFGLEDEDSLKVNMPKDADSSELINNEIKKEIRSRFARVLKKLTDKKSREEFRSRLPNYISVGMFVLVPLTALIFYLMFYKNTFYIKHLVFTIHLQSTMYILFIILNLIEILFKNRFTEILSLILFLFLLFIWIKNFYEINWFKTVWKMIVFLFFYGLLFIVFLAVVAGVNIWFL
jgi:hypothetical protein